MPVDLAAMAPPALVEQAPTFEDRVRAHARKLGATSVPSGIEKNNPGNLRAAKTPGNVFTGHQMSPHGAILPFADAAGRAAHVNGLRATTRLVHNLSKGKTKGTAALEDTDPRNTFRRLITHFAPPVEHMKDKTLVVRDFDYCRTPRGGVSKCENDTGSYIESVIGYLRGLPAEGGGNKYFWLSEMGDKLDDMSRADIDFGDIVPGGLDNDDFLVDVVRAIVRHENGAGWENLFTDDAYREALRTSKVSE